MLLTQLRHDSPIQALELLVHSSTHFVQTRTLSALLFTRNRLLEHVEQTSSPLRRTASISAISKLVSNYCEKAYHFRQ